jgi:hypothetical protein
MIYERRGKSAPPPQTCHTAPDGTSAVVLARQARHHMPGSGARGRRRGRPDTGAVAEIVFTCLLFLATRMTSLAFTGTSRIGSQEMPAAELQLQSYCITTRAFLNGNANDL